MSTGGAAGCRNKENGAYRYQRHQLENTLLYRIVERYYPEFTEYLAEQGAILPRYVQREFEAYLKCGRLEHGFLRVQCNDCHAEHLVAFSCKCRGFCPCCGARRMAESAALLVDEILPEQPMRQWVLSFPYPRARACFHRVDEPTSAELTPLVHKIAHRVGRYLERQGWLEHDVEHAYLALDTADDDPLSVLQGHSISYRIALGTQAGRKVLTLLTLPPVDIGETYSGSVGEVAGFNLHAGVAARGDQRRKLERLCRYIARPAVSEHRLSLIAQGKVRYQLKTPYADGTTHFIFEPLDFISRLAALVPKPRVNLTRYHGVFAPNSEQSARVTPSRRGRANKAKVPGPKDATSVASPAAMSWALRLKRVFGIDIATCTVCGGSMKVIACIEDPAVIKKILTHLRSKGPCVDDVCLPQSRAPTQDDLFS